MYGCIMDNQVAAINVLQYTLIIMMFGCGQFINLVTASWFIKFLGYISPFRYTIELLMRSLLKDLNYVDSLCSFYDFTFKNEAFYIISGMAIGFFIMGWIAILIRSRRM